MKIFFALAAHGGLFHTPFVGAMFQLLPALEKNGIGISMSTVSFPDIEVSRNYLATMFVDHRPDCTHMLIVDADMGFPPQLIADMIGIDADVAGCAYPRKGIDLAALRAAPPEEDLAAAVRRSLSFIHGGLDRGQERLGFVRTDACGTGVMLIRRRVFETMIEKMPEIVDEVRVKRMPFAGRFARYLTPFDKVRTEDRELSTDYSFCHRWVAGCGGEIWINTRHPITHTGSFDFAGALDG